MKTVVVFLLAASSVATSQDAVQWRVEDGGNGHWYQLIVNESDLPMPYAEALSLVPNGASLTSLTSQDEHNFVAFTIAEPENAWLAFYRGPLIGLVRVDGCDYAWVTGEALDFTQWHPGNPNDCAASPWVQLWDRDSRNWQNNGGSDRFNSLIVEWSNDCNNDGIVDYGQILDGSLSDVDKDGVPDECTNVACCIGSTCISAALFACQQAGGTSEGFGVVCSSQVCPSSCEGDTTGNGVVDFADLISVLSSWGPCSDG